VIRSGRPIVGISHASQRRLIAEVERTSTFAPSDLPYKSDYSNHAMSWSVIDGVLEVEHLAFGSKRNKMTKRLAGYL